MVLRSRSTMCVATAVLLALGLAACGGSGSDSAAGGGLPSEVKITSISSITGATGGFAGIQADQAMKLAVEEVNDQKFLGPETKLVVDAKDSQSLPRTAASLASAAIQDKSVSALLGPLISNEAVAVAPLVQKAELPTAFTQAASDGVVVGDYTFRVTAPQSTYYGSIAGPFLKSKDVKTLGILYTSDVVTLQQLATKYVTPMASEQGIEVASSTGVSATTLDFSAPVSKVVERQPDAVALLLTGAATSNAVSVLRQSGYKGLVISTYAAGVGNLKAAGQDGAGIVWPSNFTADEQTPGAKAFVDAFTAKYGSKPSNYAAERYDAVWFLARGIKEAQSSDRAEIQKGLAAVAKTGFDGAEGKITFDGNDARLNGLLVEWDGKQELVVDDGA